MSARTWVAFLRGINVGKHKRVAMADLRDLLEGLGYGEVRTHLTSGNAVFTCSDDDPAEIGQQMEAGIAASFEFDVRVMVRSLDGLGAVVESNPFVERGIETKQLHAVFLSGDPSQAAMDALDPSAYSPDEFELGYRVMYVRLPNGVMGSKLPDWERALGVDATMRTWNTVTRVLKLALPS